VAQVRSSIYPSRRDRVRISGPSLVIALLLGSATLTAQEVPRLDTVPVAVAGPGLRLPPRRDSLILTLPPELQPMGRLGNPAKAAEVLTAALGRDLAGQRSALWRDVVTRRARAAAALGGLGWLAGTADFALYRARHAPGSPPLPLLVTSVLIPPLAVGHWLHGWVRHRNARPLP